MPLIRKADTVPLRSWSGAMVDLILPGRGRRLVRTLAARRGRPTLLRLVDGREVMVWNFVWGRHRDPEWEHLTLNLSPRVAGGQIVTLSAADVTAALDAETGRVLHRRN